MTKLEIVINDNGSCTVTGPIDNKLLAYGMLDIARDVIKDHKPSPILKPINGTVPNDLKPN